MWLLMVSARQQNGGAQSAAGSLQSAQQQGALAPLPPLQLQAPHQQESQMPIRQMGLLAPPSGRGSSVCVPFSCDFLNCVCHQ